MFLKSLDIHKKNELIRHIPFHKGLNLIIDETKNKNQQETGNNVGKTTVLRLIDFCLGGNGENIYRDTEFKGKSNSQIESFLKNEDVLITLKLKKDLDEFDSLEIEIKRNFKKRKEKIQMINGDNYNSKDFDQKLKQLIFQKDVSKPTFRQIIAKNIRYEKYRLENTVRVLHQTTTFEEYETLYFFWLGIDTDSASKKQKLQFQKSTEESLLKRLKVDSSYSEIEQALTVIERDIEELSIEKSNFSINENYEKDLSELNTIKNNINNISTSINRYNIRKQLIEESREELEKEKVLINTDQLSSIYESAERLIPTIQIKFNELVQFHNQMLQEKLNFITEELPRLTSELKELKEKLKEEVQKEKSISYKLKKNGAIQELEVIVQKLNLKFEQKGRYEEQLRQWNEVNARIQDIEKELLELNLGIASLDNDLDNKIKSFNKYFSKISERLYGEQFILSKDKNERTYDLKITSIGGNLGTGKKKGQIAAFDLAYIQYCDDNDIPCLHFILYDQVETIHDNQINVLAEVIKGTNSQLVVPVLKDKLPINLNPDEYKVLSLSQDCKLFKIT